MILIDESVEPTLGVYLQLHGLKEVITVAWDKNLKQSSDDELKEFCDHNNALLITKDKDFFESYTGRKVFISNGRNYEDIQKDLQYKLNSDSELKRLRKKVIELDSFIFYFDLNKFTAKTLSSQYY